MAVTLHTSLGDIKVEVFCDEARSRHHGTERAPRAHLARCPRYQHRGGFQRAVL